MSRMFQKTGVMAIGSRLRILGERMGRESEKIFALYEVDIKPKWYPVVFSLLDEESKTITSIANEIGHSHVSVVKIVKEMSTAGLINEQKDSRDKRKTNLTLSRHAKEVLKGLDQQTADVTLAMEKMTEEMEHNIWLALDEFEALFDAESTYSRVLDVKRAREAGEIEGGNNIGDKI